MARGHVTESLSAYLDAQVSASERERIESHLRGCEECRAHLEGLRRTVGVVRGLDPVPAPEGFRAAVRSRLAQESVARRRWALPRLRLSWKAAGAVAAVLLIGLFSVNLLRETRPTALAPEAGRAVEPSAPGAADRSINVPKLGAPAAPGLTVPPVTSLPALRQIIRTAHVEVSVDDFDATVRSLVALAEGAGGFVASSSYAQSAGTPEGLFTLRVPAPRFATVLEGVEHLGTVDVRRISGQDVTEEFVDLGSRVRNLERHEQRLLSFMDRATKVSDLLAIEQELARVRGEIEILTGRLRFLSHQVDLATVEVAVRQKTGRTSGFWDFGASVRRMREAFLTTVRQLLSLAERAAVLLSALVPVAALVVILWLIVRKYRLRTV